MLKADRRKLAARGAHPRPPLAATFRMKREGEKINAGAASHPDGSAGGSFRVNCHDICRFNLNNVLGGIGKRHYLAVECRHLQSSFDNVGRRDQRCSRHTSDGTCCQQRQRRVVSFLISQSRFAVSIDREVDGAEGNITQETGFCTLHTTEIRQKEIQLLHTIQSIPGQQVFISRPPVTTGQQHATMCVR